MADSQARIKNAKKLLTELGYTVNLPVKYKLHSFEVEQSVLQEFLSECGARKFKVKEAVSEALDMWLDVIKNGKPSK